MVTLNAQQISQFGEFLDKNITLETIVESQTSALKRLQTLPAVGADDVKKQIEEEFKSYETLTEKYLKFFFGEVLGLSDDVIELVKENYIVRTQNGAKINPLVGAVIADVGTQILDAYKDNLKGIFAKQGYEMWKSVYSINKYTANNN